ncbi:glycosyltransferase family 39 protein [Candidatus Bathyarchaeota archaeon]|nr:glycosyltransferase family 39 protein [Candidatus Bathyarchaeota archaeon]
MNDWIAFMHGEASIALFFIYCIAGVVGISLTLFFKKELHLLNASHKVIAVSFLLTTIIGVSVFTYLNFSATQENYTWMHDGMVYQQMGQSFLVNHEFIIDGRYTHHFAPVYPLYLAVFYTFLPVHIGTQIAVEIIVVLSLIVTLIVTRKLYGLTPALITTGLIATVPTYLFSASRNYAEPIMLILYTLTIYFILESLNPEKGNRIIAAGLCAALGFLTKSSLGYFFIVTGLAGFLWRFYYMKWRIFKNKNYLMAVLVFLVLVIAWTGRNLYLFWDGSLSGLFAASQTSDYFTAAMVHSLGKDFGSVFIQFWFFMVLTVLFMLSYTWIFSAYVKNSFSRIRDERISCLWLSIMLPLFIGWLIGAIYFVFENDWMPDYLISYYPVSQARYLVFTLIRYCFVVIVPFSWLAYESAKKEPRHSNQ